MKKYEIVSLGLNCMPRTILTRHKIKPSKADGELSCPFDLVYHEFDTIIDSIENNFGNYFQDFYFKQKKKRFFFSKNKGFWKKKDGTIFYHDSDCSEMDLDKLINRINNRISNFNNILNSDKPILFVLNLVKNGDIKALYNAILKKRIDKPFKIAIFDFNNFTQFNEQINENIYILRLPSPINDYPNNWHFKNFIKSDLGIYTELVISNFIKDILSEKPFI